MQLGVVGLGRMGGNIVRRLLRAGHDCVVHDRDPAPGRALAGEGATAADGLAGLVAALDAPRAVWVMLPSGDATEGTVAALPAALARRHASSTAATRSGRTTSAAPPRCGRRASHYVDVGTSGGVWGLERGYCLMIGGEAAAVRRLDPIFARARARPRRHPGDARAATAATPASRRATSMPGRAAPAISSR